MVFAIKTLLTDFPRKRSVVLKKHGNVLRRVMEGKKARGKML